MIRRWLWLLFVVALGTAGEAPLDRSTYLQAATTIADLVEHGDVAGATSAGQSVERRGWRDHGRTLPADPAFVGGGYDEPGRIAALRSLALLLAAGDTRNAPEPDPALLDRLRPPRVPGDEGSDLALPDVPDSWAGFLDWVRRTCANALNWLLERLGDLTRWVLPQRSDGGGTDITQVAVGLCLVLVTAIVCTVAILWWRRRRSAAPHAVGDSATASEEAVDRPVSEWERRGDLLLAAGEHRAALRAFFHAALAAAFAAGRLHHRRGRTNWEYVAQVPARSTWRASLVALVQTFERSWYGGHETSAADCRRFRAAVTALTQDLRDPAVDP
jgi:hypothetical protein